MIQRWAQVALIPTLMILAIAVTEMATDIYVPSLAYLTDYFSTTQDTLAATLSLNLWGFAIASLFYGPLSDSFGRKAILAGGLAIFVLSSFMCGISPSIEWLLVARVFQGIGGGVSNVVGTAIIKDIYDGEDCARIMSFMGIAVAVSPAVAPILGGYVAEHYGWQWVFFIVGGFSAVVMAFIGTHLPETLAKDQRQEFSLKGSIMNYKTLLSSLRFLSYTMISALTFAGLWAYVSSTSFYYISVLGYTKVEYGYFQAVLVGAYIVGSFHNGRLLSWLGLDRALDWGLATLVFSGILLVASAILAPHSAYWLCAAMWVNCFAMGIVFPNAVTRVLEVFPQMKGASSAMLSMVEMAAAGLMIWITGLIYAEEMFPVTVAILATAVLGVIFLKVARVRSHLAPTAV